MARDRLGIGVMPTDFAAFAPTGRRGAQGLPLTGSGGLLSLRLALVAAAPNRARHDHAEQGNAAQHRGYTD
jgi:hypothetical protein